MSTASVSRATRARIQSLAEELFGIDGHPVADVVDLTTVHQPVALLGRAATRPAPRPARDRHRSRDAPDTAPWNATRHAVWRPHRFTPGCCLAEDRHPAWQHYDAKVRIHPSSLSGMRSTAHCPHGQAHDQDAF